MVTNGITVEDIRNLAEGKLSVVLPTYHAAVSARNLVSYTRKAYPLPDVDYATSTELTENGDYRFTIEVTKQEG